MKKKAYTCKNWNFNFKQLSCNGYIQNKDLIFVRFLGSLRHPNFRDEKGNWGYAIIDTKYGLYRQ